VSTAPEDPDEAASQESGVVVNRAATPVSGNVLLSDALLETPIPESDPQER
jgi:hypothetical protein